MNKVEPLAEIPSAQSQTFSSNSQDSNPKNSKENSIPYPSHIPQNNPKNFFEKPKPIGLYNFSSNKDSITSLEQNIDEVVSSFIEKNKLKIIDCVTKEVQKKFDEKIIPMTNEISNIKQDFISLYEDEWKEFKQANMLDECHNSIMDLNNKIDIMEENISNYNDKIKGFNIADNRLQFLNKLNKDLENFIQGIKSDEEGGVHPHPQGKNLMDLEENIHKIEKEQRKQENLSMELDSVFYETMDMLKDIANEENNESYKIVSNATNSNDILNNFKNMINTFQNKFNYEKQFMENYSNINNGYFNESDNKNENKQNYPFDEIPNFFD